MDMSITELTAVVELEPQPAVASVETGRRELTPAGYLAFNGDPILTFRGSQIAYLT